MRRFINFGVIASICSLILCCASNKVELGRVSKLVILSKAERKDDVSRIVRYYINESGGHVSHGATLVFSDGHTVGDTEWYEHGHLVEIRKGSAHRNW